MQVSLSRINLGLIGFLQQKLFEDSKNQSGNKIRFGSKLLVFSNTLLARLNQRRNAIWRPLYTNVGCSRDRGKFKLFLLICCHNLLVTMRKCEFYRKSFPFISATQQRREFVVQTKSFNTFHCYFKYFRFILALTHLNPKILLCLRRHFNNLWARWHRMTFKNMLNGLNCSWKGLLQQFAWAPPWNIRDSFRRLQLSISR